MATASTTPRLARADRRDRLLAAAAELFADGGYATPSIDAIGARAGITGPAVYRHFSGKRDLLLTLLSNSVDSTTSAIESALKPAAAPLENLQALVSQVTRQIIAERRVLGVLYARHGTLAAADRERVDRLRLRVVDVWMKVFRAARPALSESETGLYVAAALSLVAAFARRPIDDDVEAERVYNRLLMAMLTA